MARALLLLICLWFCLATSALAGDADQEDLVAKIKAAYLFKFGNYVQWPDAVFDNPQAPLLIGVVGADAVATELESLSKANKVKNRPVVVKRLLTNDTTSVHILYVGNSAAGLMPSYAEAHASSMVLYVSDELKQLENYSVIRFVIDGNRVRFDISVPAAQRNNIKLDASLMTVARKVIPSQ